MNKYDTSSFIDQLKKFEIVLTDDQIDQFLKYYELLIDWNERMNLTAITGYDEVITKHFVDSAALAAYITPKSGHSLIDVGTGAGFPGIPLKIIFPELKVVLLDSLNKRINFLNEVIDTLGLKEIETIHSRAEDGARDPELRECFDYAVSRAVANLSTLSEYCLPYVREGGIFVSYKSGDCGVEVKKASNAIQKLGAKTGGVTTFQLTLKNEVLDRSLIFIEKTGHTPGQYPRKAGVPVKKPL